MGESKKDFLRVQFDPGVKLEFHGAKITSDGGLLLFREMDEVAIPRSLFALILDKIAQLRLLPGTG
jgi:hypothetical protein